MNISDFFTKHPKTAIAFSGGVDSSYLLYAAIKYGVQSKAYFVKSAFQPGFELRDAKRLASELNAELEIIEADVLTCRDITQNLKERCYHCKKLIFSQISAKAIADGYDTLLDGTNASDDISDRPGIKAIKELKVISPLRECALTKAEIRKLSRQAGLFTYDKPAYACLATRIPTGEVITKDKLVKTENAENYLFSLGFTDFRIRMTGEAAKIQIPSSQMEQLLLKRKDIVSELKKYYSSVTLDMETRDE